MEPQPESSPGTKQPSSQPPTGITRALRAVSVWQRVAIVAAAGVCAAVGLVAGPSIALWCAVVLGLFYLSLKMRWSRTQTALGLLNDLASKDPMVREKAFRAGKLQAMISLVGGTLTLIFLIALAISR